MTTISHIFKSATYGGTTLEKKLVALSKVLLIVALLNVPLISSEVQAQHF